VSQEQIAKVLAEHFFHGMSLNEKSGAWEAECTCNAVFPAFVYGHAETAFAAHQAAVLAPLFAEAQAEALREAADEAFRDKALQGLQRVVIGNWLRSRATHIEGRALVAGIHERKQAKTNND